MPQTIRIGSLFTGYGGLDMGVRQAFNQPTRIAWVCDIEPGPRLLLHYRHPDIPNLGDVTRVDWARVPPVDVICGGSPCQDVSSAGQRRGMRPGTRSGLWSYQADAVHALHPRLMVWENVQGALSAPAMTRTPHGTLRALGRVLGDLANLRYDAMWRLVDASRTGAPHRRRRLFLIAWPHSALPLTPPDHPQCVWDPTLDLWTRPDPDLFGEHPTFTAPWPDAGWMTQGKAGMEPAFLTGPAVRLLPTPNASYDTGRHGSRTPDHRRRKGVQINLADIMEKGGRPDGDYGPYRPAVSHWARVLNRSAPCATIIPVPYLIAARRLPVGLRDRRLLHRNLLRSRQTIPLFDGRLAAPGTDRWINGRLAGTPLAWTPRNLTGPDVWNHDACMPGTMLPPAAIRRLWDDTWRLLGRRPPSVRALNPMFVEWMMGLPEGWVTDPRIWDGTPPGRRRRLQLRMLGNGVVPQQAAMAVRMLTGMIARHAQTSNHTGRTLTSSPWLKPGASRHNQQRR